MLNPTLVTAVRSLRFQEDSRVELRRIDSVEWPALLKLIDQAQITLPLGIRCREFMPNSVQTRIDRNLASNAMRYERLFAEYQQIASILRKRSIDFVLLKGLSQMAPLYVSDPRHRPQYDIDLYCPHELLESAFDTIVCAGFSPVKPRGKCTDHLPPMMRTSNWKWCGDYYDPELPLTVELHFRFWDPETERVPAPWVEDFWRRRASCIIRGVEIPTLSLSDGISYSALHLMRHLFRGDLRIYHVYETAHFLQQTWCDDELWGGWLDDRLGMAPHIETAAFRLAAEWFGCRVHPIVNEAFKRLPPDIERWFRLFGYSPLALQSPTKDELFLHLSLLDKTLDRCSVAVRRLLPVHAGLRVHSVPGDKKGWVPVTLMTAIRQAKFVVWRSIHHISTNVRLIRSYFRWKMSVRKYAVP
jgi:hypothetical protein